MIICQTLVDKPQTTQCVGYEGLLEDCFADQKHHHRSAGQGTHFDASTEPLSYAFRALGPFESRRRPVPSPAAAGASTSLAMVALLFRLGTTLY